MTQIVKTHIQSHRKVTTPPHRAHPTIAPFPNLVEKNFPLNPPALNQKELKEEMNQVSDQKLIDINYGYKSPSS